MELLRTTPSAGAIGTCRYKLKADQGEDFDRIVEVLRAHDIGYFFYIGGNDSMDTAHKVAALARERGYELVATGVPKTIDNDVGDPEFRLIDHTPGYGSAARYWACHRAGRGRGEPGHEPLGVRGVLQAMGRKSGSSPRPRAWPTREREMPLQLYIAEARHTLETLAENVNRELGRSGRCIVVVSEGFDVGSLGEAHDGFGHIEYGASANTVAQVVVNHLNRVGLKARGHATGQVPGVLQRSTSIYASTVDAEEACEVGRKAVEIGVREGSGWMATILRAPGDPYRARYDKVPLEKVAARPAQLPAGWIARTAWT